jgi:hypothetical protein
VIITCYFTRGASRSSQGCAEQAIDLRICRNVIDGIFKSTAFLALFHVFAGG